MIRTIFIIGNKRSGSTQLVKLLNLHPNVFVSDEADTIWILYRFHHHLEMIPYPGDTALGINHTLKNYGHLLSQEQSPLENFFTLQKALMTGGGIKLPPMHKEKLLWLGDKKPFQQIDPEIVPFLKQNFPHSKFIHLIRHPFPVVNSSKLFIGDLWKGLSEQEILERWTVHERWVNLEKAKGELMILDVKYEDLIENTQQEMRRIFDFLEVSSDQALLHTARKLTFRQLKLHPRLSCPPETQTIMAQYGYPTQSLWLEQQWYVNTVNRFRKLKQKLTGGR
ncbi:MAG: sulfotransferase [Pseudomonadota bacterium]|nr:sulfotransferase [Pseudomonadota bacterium]